MTDVIMLDAGTITDLTRLGNEGFDVLTPLLRYKAEALRER